MRGLVHGVAALATIVLAALPAGAQTLAEALDACEAFVANHAIPENVDTDLTLFGDYDYATYRTEAGEVVLSFAEDYGPTHAWFCDLQGADPRDKDGPITATWAAGLPFLDAWLERRGASGEGKVVPMFGEMRTFAVCPEEGEPYFVTAQPIDLYERTEGLADADRPFFVRALNWTGSGSSPCDF